MTLVFGLLIRDIEGDRAELAVENLALRPPPVVLVDGTKRAKWVVLRHFLPGGFLSLSQQIAGHVVPPRRR